MLKNQNKKKMIKLKLLKTKKKPLEPKAEETAKQ